MDGVFGFTAALEILVLLSFFMSTKTMTNSNSLSNSLCIEIERDALLKFKKELEDSSNRLSSWISDTDCCKWIGIRCNTSTGHVKELNLANTRYGNWETRAEWISFQNYQLKGNLSDSILNLKHISHIDLSYNDFEGIQIPSFLGSLVSLNYLNLSGSGFQGLIPHQLGNLSNLQQLGLRGNYKLYSENLQWLEGLHSLLSLDLSYTNLSKVSDWLPDINKLPSLAELHLSECKLSYITPLSHVNFTSLSILDISGNDFYPYFIPKWISNLGSLVSLDLSYNGFEGPLPGGFSNLTSLKNLNLAYNGLNSSLPIWFFSLPSISSFDMRSNYRFEVPIPCAFQNFSALTYLDLSYANFNSTIPSCFYSLNNLQYLNLVSVGLKGEISNDIVNLTNLVSIDLSYNHLQGSIPRSIGTMCNLRSISLSNNEFHGNLSELFDGFSHCIADSSIFLSQGGTNITNSLGHFTDHVAKLRNLQALDLSYNFICGPIPESMGNFSSLKYLNLVGNELNGTLPKSMGSLSSLQKLDISNNRLEGIVTEVHFVNLVNLKYLDMSANNLTLSFSVGWIPPFNLDNINLRSCNLGQFPKWLKSQRKVYGLDLSNAKISDIVPDWFWNLSATSNYLNLSHNQLLGEIPDFLLNSQLTMISLNSNKFYGNLPRISSDVIELDLSNNSFSGNVSHFLCHSRSQENMLEVLHLGDNFLSGNIPDCWTKWTSLARVKLNNNNLFGKLPRSMGSLSNLESLHLRNNNLSGEIPQFLKNLLNLNTLDLSLNAFQGNIPTWIGTNLSNLIILGLRSNELSGLIPNELCHLSFLQIVDIGNNALIGSIPLCFGNFTAMATKRTSFNYIMFYYHQYGDGKFWESAYVTTKGGEFQYDSILTLMTSMDLSDNNLSGEIPLEITNLLELRSLNLSGNRLKGRIPQLIGSMTNMESLDFSRNQLSGQIPPSISKLTFLNHLNLSHNNLLGPIPTSTQLQSLDPSSFIGNKLCGPPLTKSCKREGKTSENGEAKEGDEKYFDEWFYLSLTIGFVVGFWGIWGPLLISKTWRRTYFMLLNSLLHKLSC